MADQFEIACLHRIGSDNPQKRERHSFDFVVNGTSLFEAAQASKYDMCGCLSDPQFERDVARRINGKTVAALTSDALFSGYRVPLFICPECGDFACGAITARVSRTEFGIRWSDFAYENGSDAACEVALGPFEFEWAIYVSELGRSIAD